MQNDCRFADVKGDGTLAVLLAVDNTIEARDGMTGKLLRTYTFPGTVTSFDVSAVPEPSTLPGHRPQIAEKPAKAGGDKKSLPKGETGPGPIEH